MHTGSLYIKLKIESDITSSKHKQTHGKSTRGTSTSVITKGLMLMSGFSHSKIIMEHFGLVVYEAKLSFYERNLALFKKVYKFSRIYF